MERLGGFFMLEDVSGEVVSADLQVHCPHPVFLTFDYCLRCRALRSCPGLAGIHTELVLGSQG